MGAGSWNGWRKVNPDVRPDLHKADLRAARLWEFDLTGKPISINLTGANLSETDLSGTQLSEANLSEADLMRILTRTRYAARPIASAAISQQPWAT
jgi:hypothetical protein